MHKDEVELMLKRAKGFSEAAKERFQKRDWDLTCFLTEQSVQLLLKAILLEVGGEFPKTHSIRQLCGLLYHITENEQLNFNRKDLIFLENAYLNSRYFNFIYEKEDAKEALRIAKNIRKVIKTVRRVEKEKRND
ncbi:MAG: HEPN domain-containing protein [Promethearchaeia archaeon]